MVDLSVLISPAGDPGPWKDAAAAWRKFAGDLKAMGGDLESKVGKLQGPAWSGTDRDKFVSYWTNALSPEFKDAQIAAYNGVADKLDETADKIDSWNAVARMVEAAVAGAAIFTIATGGLGALFGGGEVAAAAIAEGAAELTAFEVFCQVATTAFISYLKFWAATFVFGLAANAVGIAVVAPDHNPLNLDHWSLRGIAEAGNAATVVGSLGALGAFAPVAAFAEGHALAWNFGTGAFAGGGPAVYNLLEVEHAKLWGDPRGAQYDAWWKIALFAGVSGGWNTFMGKAFGGKPFIVPDNIENPSTWLPKGWVLTESGLAIPKPTGWFGSQDPLIQSAITGFLPSTALRATVPFPPGTTFPPDHGPPTIGDILAPPAPVHAVLAPPTVGGGSYTVQSGDSMWIIAGRELGDSTLWTHIAAANPHISDPDVILPGQVLHIPKILAPHPS
ncbi:MAG: hypothetical protein DLM59_03070 [Pseudonocardiales bacterium]|nr:MAG: hypothetical protein DLM59_03070 [Pseudonocardiales bacterium]